MYEKKCLLRFKTELNTKVLALHFFVELSVAIIYSCLMFLHACTGTINNTKHLNQNRLSLKWITLS